MIVVLKERKVRIKWLKDWWLLYWQYVWCMVTRMMPQSNTCFRFHSHFSKSVCYSWLDTGLLGQKSSHSTSLYSWFVSTTWTFERCLSLPEVIVLNPASVIHNRCSDSFLSSSFWYKKWQTNCPNSVEIFKFKFAVISNLPISSIL